MNASVGPSCRLPCTAYSQSPFTLLFSSTASSCSLPSASPQLITLVPTFLRNLREPEANVHRLSWPRLPPTSICTHISAPLPVTTEPPVHLPRADPSHHSPLKHILLAAQTLSFPASAMFTQLDREHTQLLLFSLPHQ